MKISFNILKTCYLCLLILLIFFPVLAYADESPVGQTTNTPTPVSQEQIDNGPSNNGAVYYTGNKLALAIFPGQPKENSDKYVKQGTTLEYDDSQIKYQLGAQDNAADILKSTSDNLKKSYDVRYYEEMKKGGANGFIIEFYDKDNRSYCIGGFYYYKQCFIAIGATCTNEDNINIGRNFVNSLEINFELIDEMSPIEEASPEPTPTPEPTNSAIPEGDLSPVEGDIHSWTRYYSNGKVMSALFPAQPEELYENTIEQYRMGLFYKDEAKDIEYYIGFDFNRNTNGDNTSTGEPTDSQYEFGDYKIIENFGFAGFLVTANEKNGPHHQLVASYFNDNNIFTIGITYKDPNDSILAQSFVDSLIIDTNLIGSIKIPEVPAPIPTPSGELSKPIPSSIPSEPSSSIIPEPSSTPTSPVPSSNDLYSYFPEPSEKILEANSNIIADNEKNLTVMTIIRWAALATGVLLILTVIVYMILRKSPFKKCKDCGRKILKKTNFCLFCGEPNKKPN